jgi:cytochrome o ubiquinol oxidase subunit 1
MLWFVAFVVTFTIGGVTGVMLAVPAIDFVVHNSLFLVAHFHNVIIGGVVFGAFAGYTYWFPKLTGIKLHEGLGKASVWMWTVGFFLAFMPLYLLGFMGAVRRMDHYDPSLGWQGLFIVSGVGVMVILLGVGFQVLQTAYSVWRFKKGDKEYVAGPDPWDGRTLEWSTSTPIAEYNFATMTPVKERDAYWEIKQSHEKIPEKAEDIVLPKNTGYGVFIAGAAFVAGFAIIWHVWWVAVLGVVAAIILVIAATLREDTEYTITAKEVLATEKKLRRLKV